MLNLLLNLTQQVISHLKTLRYPFLLSESDLKTDNYWYGYGYKVKFTATLHNYGDANGYAVVEFSTAWDDSVRDYEIKTVFAPAHSSVNVTSDLDANYGRTTTYGYRIIEQRNA